MTSHSCLLLLAGTTSTILRAGLVEFPRQVEREGTAGGIVDGDITDAIDDAAILVGVEHIVATQVGCQGAETAQVEITLHAEVGSETGASEAEVVDVALRRIAEPCV